MDRGHAIGVHTHNHPFLAQLRRSEVRKEVSECLTHLRRITGSPSLALDVAYPDGNYDQRTVDVLEEMGARSAVTIDLGAVTGSARPLEMPRVPVDDTDYPGFALFKLTGAYRVLKRVMPDHRRAD